VQFERDSVARLPYERDRDEAERNEADIYVVPVTGGTPRRLALIPGGEGQIEWSPDGRMLGFIHRPGARQVGAPGDHRRGVGGRVRNLIGDFQYEPNGFEWLSNGELRWSPRWAAARGSSASAPTARGRRARCSAGVAACRASPSTGQAHGGLRRDQHDEADGALRRQRRRHGRARLTSFNDAISREIAFSDAERFTYKSVGDLEIEGWLMKPYGYQAGQEVSGRALHPRRPALGLRRELVRRVPEPRRAGMFVLFTNPRGSSGYGADFTYSTRGRWFAEDYQDLMKAVDIAPRAPTSTRRAWA
jgi:dipeptidyl aminopeptidase/acylaminoacyl peptidase